jgi:hypothetical protein
MCPAFRAGGNWFESFDIANNATVKIKTPILGTVFQSRTPKLPVFCAAEVFFEKIRKKTTMMEQPSCA